MHPIMNNSVSFWEVLTYWDALPHFLSFLAFLSIVYLLCSLLERRLHKHREIILSYTFFGSISIGVLTFFFFSE
jgi:hypothetical protein